MDDFEEAFRALTSSTLKHNAQTPQAVATLAEASRTQPDIRSRLANPDVLRSLVDIIKYSPGRQDFKTAVAALKCVGNACIDNDSGRDAICSIGFDWAKQYLEYTYLLTRRSDTSKSPSGDSVELASLTWLTAKVLYNICSDHPAAQLQCFEAELYLPLITICAWPKYYPNLDERSIVYDVLFWIAVQRTDHPPQVKKPLVYRDLDDLLTLACCGDQDLEDFATVMEIILTFLRDPDWQEFVITERRVSDVWNDTLVKVTTRLRKPEPEAQELLKPLVASFSWCLSDIAAHPGFVEEYRPNKGWVRETCPTENGQEWIHTLLDIITTSGGPEECQLPQQSDAHLLAAGSQILGNLLRALPADDVAFLVEDRALHAALWNICLIQRYNTDEEVLHSVAGLLVQLTRPSTHIRELIGSDKNAGASLTMLCKHKTPQIKQDGTRLLRALGKDCPHNQERFAELAESALASAQEARPSTGTGSVEEITDGLNG